jgi:hypothetical protein
VSDVATRPKNLTRIDPWLLPYGGYVEPAGSIVLHDRCYRPIARFSGNAAFGVVVEGHRYEDEKPVPHSVTLPLEVEPVAPDEFIEFTDQFWLYGAPGDKTSARWHLPTRRKLRALVEQIPALRAEITQPGMRQNLDVRTCVREAA